MAVGRRGHPAAKSALGRLSDREVVNDSYPTLLPAAARPATVIQYPHPLRMGREDWRSPSAAHPPRMAATRGAGVDFV
jgi:hypothetical protein